MISFRNKPIPCNPEQLQRYCREVLFPVLVDARKKVDAAKAARNGENSAVNINQVRPL